MERVALLSQIEKLRSLHQAHRPYIRYDNYERICSLLDERRGDFSGFLKEVAYLWGDNMVKLCSFLVRVADYRLEDKDGVINKQKVYRFVAEMADLWEDINEDDTDDKEKLHSFLFEKVFHVRCDHSSTVEMADLWKDCKGKLSSGKVYSWLDKKADYWRDDEKRLIGMLHELALSEGDVEYRGGHDYVLRYVNDLIDDLRIILDNKLEDHLQDNYFISDALEMADDAHTILRVMKSDIFILFSQILMNCFIQSEERRGSYQTTTDKMLRRFIQKINDTKVWLQDTKKRMVESGDQELLDHSISDAALGLEEEVELLLRIQNDHPCTLIWGKACIGKTTLARELYNHADIVDGYECRAWVSLPSEEYLISGKDLLIKLIRQMPVDHNQRDDDDMLMSKMDNKSLRQKLHRHLHGRRYFIVLDNVFEYSLPVLYSGTAHRNRFIKYVQKALPNDGASRMVFTSRKYIKGHGVDAFDYKKEYLDDDKSWQLLLKTALIGSSDGEFPKRMERKGREVLRKCGGLPIAIKEVGRQWAEMRLHGAKWEQVVGSLKDLDWSETLVALDHTYQSFERVDVGDYLRTCFLYLAFFKEDTTIKAFKLMQILAAGVVDEEERYREFEDIYGKCCLDRLVYESVVLAEVTGFQNVRLHINTVFHKLAVNKAEKDIGLEIQRNDHDLDQAAEPSHRVIHCNRDNFYYSSRDQDKHLVSLFFHGGGVCHPSYWNSFEKLQILDMEGFGLKILPERVSELTELIYLGLRNNYIQELPHSLGRLKRLEVLDIAQNFMVEMADVIWEMDSLAHLYMSDVRCRKPLKIDALKQLKTLTYISVDNWTYEGSCLQMMTSLRKLGLEEVDGDSDVSKLFASLAKLNELKCLILRGFRFRSMPSLDDLGILRGVTHLKLEGRLTMLPGADNFPPKLEYLSLVNSRLDEDPMPILEKLSHLCYLNFRNAYTGEQMVISSKGFCSLHYLLIGELWHLRKLHVGKPALQHLKELEIYSCPQYKKNVHRQQKKHKREFCFYI